MRRRRRFRYGKRSVTGRRRYWRRLNRLILTTLSLELNAQCLRDSFIVIEDLNALLEQTTKGEKSFCAEIEQVREGMLRTTRDIAYAARELRRVAYMY